PGRRGERDERPGGLLPLQLQLRLPGRGAPARGRGMGRERKTAARRGDPRASTRRGGRESRREAEKTKGKGVLAPPPRAAAPGARAGAQDGMGGRNGMDFEQGDGGEMRELALFAGAGGGILGGRLLGWRCVCAV